MDLTLEYPELTAALVMVGSGPTGLKLDVPPSAKFVQAQQADEAKDWELLNELEVQIWFDGEGRTPDQVDAKARVLALDMNRRALDYAAQNRGKHKPQMQPSAAERLADLHLPVLIVYGDRDVAYIQHAADYMFQHIPGARKVLMPNTAHLPNMERPTEFNQIVLDFLQKLS